MRPILFLQYPKCGTCQKAQKWLKENNIAVESLDISVNNPSKEELSVWVNKSGLPIARFFNTSGRIYKEENLKEKVKSSSEDDLLDILASNGMVVKRPIIVSGNLILVGFNENEWSEKLK
ncbi:arsenate reductase [Dysgonomonas hofstadii]|uniref:Arsenate reductase n=1 Tax=Dysgonomonas hofstadii TaxID=637886 RepID=A0A840CNR3_9BACT|nr:arsenate reductase family protein [Dysgonomonas hofstadii]MBB4036319.1 arsenate reductase [Dysgonomonas hofstadii]